VFIEEGYEDTTFQKIAERCGITRTILYLYFENKKQIFAESLKRFLGSVEIEIAVVAHDESMNSEEKILKIGEMVVEACEKESKLLVGSAGLLAQAQGSRRKSGRKKCAGARSECGTF